MNLAVIARVSESNLSGWGNVTTLERAFAVNSPRLTPRGPALSGWLIHIAVVALWVALFAQVFLQPLGALDVEVIARLIEKDNIRGGKQ